MTLILVVEELLWNGGVIVFRGRDATGAGVRAVASRTRLDRAPEMGETWQVTGEWQEHPVHGRQFGVKEALFVRPSGTLIIQALARSARFPNLGERKATRLWQNLGERLFDALDDGDATALAAVLPNDGETIRSLLEGWRELDGEAKAYRWLTRHSFPASLGHRVIAVYSGAYVPPEAQTDAARVGTVVWHLQRDPYRMLAFAPWRMVDAAARTLGVAHDDPRRLTGACEAVLMKRLTKGHTWIARDSMERELARFLKFPRELAQKAWRTAVETGALYEHAGGLQLAGCFVMERFVSERCAEMLSGNWRAEQMSLERELTRHSVQRELDVLDGLELHPLTSEQRAAVWMSMTEGFSCLLGGPGVGKTTVLKAVHHVAENHGRRVVQAALAGRAAQRMAETTGRPASTIAKLLLQIEHGEESLRDEPLMVIDEASMLDLPSLYRLLRVAEPGARLMLVGDPGQLPPVGFGLTFHRLAEDPAIPRLVLTKVLRQTDSSGIPHVCQAIREGRAPELLEWSAALRHGVSFLDAEPSEIADEIVDIVAALGPEEQVQVVGSVKRGVGAVVEINYHRQKLSGIGRGAPLLGAFYPGEPVIATQNDYEVGVMNGELGRVLGTTDAGGLRVDFDGEARELPVVYMPHLELAYAITCHKSQGSQFRRVVVPVTRSRLLDRTLLLTAVSRAEEQVVIVGDRRAFVEGVMAPPASLAREVGLGLR